MKPFYLFFFICCSYLVISAQEMDRRARINPYGNIQEISVSPDEKIWLLSLMGETYCTEHIDSVWHKGSLTEKISHNKPLDHFTFDRVSFFNKDIAIITGQIKTDREKFETNAIYRTTNGGKTWKLIKIGSYRFMEDSFLDTLGHGWLTTFDNFIFYTDNYGKKWKKIKISFKSTFRISSLFMIDPKKGFISSYDNELIYTENNWKTFQKIDTPLDQNKFKIKNIYDYKDLNKVIFWNSLLIIQQNGSVYYTSLDTICWKKFPVPIAVYCLDIENQELYILTKDRKVLVFKSLDQFDVISKNQITSSIRDMKVANHSLFLFSNNMDIYKINKNRSIKTSCFTTDYKITDPDYIELGDNIMWGFTDNHLYITDKNGDWVREKVLDFPINNINLLNDSIALLWDGDQNNYIYDLHNHSIRLIEPQKPLNEFLNYPIHQMIITSASSGAAHFINDRIIYSIDQDSILHTTFWNRRRYEDDTTIQFMNAIPLNQLGTILKEINEDPSRLPDMSEFTFTDQDIINYLDYINNRRIQLKYYMKENGFQIDSLYFAHPENFLQSLTNEDISKIFKQKENITSTTKNWFNLSFINTNNDTLKIYRFYYKNSLSFHFPLVIQYQGLYINCYNLPLAMVIKEALPEHFYSKNIFNNEMFILEIGNFKWKNDIDN
jgi:hypothetical protein